MERISKKRRLGLLLHTALFAPATEKHGDGGKTNERIDDAHDHRPTSEDLHDEIDLEDPNETPVQRSHHDQDPRNLM